MLWFNPAKRHGFLRSDEGERLRVDEEGLAAREEFGERCRGMRVEFEIAPDAVEEARAVNVTVVPLFAARRARSRGRR
jgi:cold shock CspA family protein